MANHYLRATLTASLDRAGTPPGDVARYEVRTRQLRGSEFYPCPSCFLRGEEQPLTLHVTGDHIDEVFCPKCNKHWEVSIPTK